MTVIRVGPASGVAHGDSATEIVGWMRSELQTLVSTATEVQHDGPNAVDVTAGCGTLAQNVARSVHADVAATADAVRVSVSHSRRRSRPRPRRDQLTRLCASSSSLRYECVPSKRDSRYGPDTIGSWRGASPSARQVSSVSIRRWNGGVTNSGDE